MHWLDPDYLPEVSGTFDRFLLDPRGAADGMMLSDGTEVHFPPHMSTELCAAIGAGENIMLKIRGVRLRGCNLIAAVAIEMSGGRRIVDNGPPNGRGGEGRPDRLAARPRGDPMDVERIVGRVLHGPRGEARGVLLEDGRIIRIPARHAECLAPLLFPGKTLAVRGEGLVAALGTVIEAREIGASIDDLQPLEPSKPRKPKHEKGRDHDADFHPA